MPSLQLIHRRRPFLWLQSGCTSDSCTSSVPLWCLIPGSKVWSLYKRLESFCFLDENCHRSRRKWTWSRWQTCFWWGLLRECPGVSFSPACTWSCPGRSCFFGNSCRWFHWGFNHRSCLLLQKISGTCPFLIPRVRKEQLGFRRGREQTDRCCE